VAGDVVAVVMAGGSGTRMGLDGNKVYLALDGRPALELPLGVLSASAHVAAIVLVVRAGDEAVARDVAARAGGRKVAAIVPGGATRHRSEQQGLAAVRRLSPAPYVLIHDGARPFLTHVLLDALMDAAREVGGAIPVLPLDGPVASEAPDGTLRLVDTSDLVRVQTPQVFAVEPLLAAYATALADGFDGVDTAQVVERCAPRVVCVAVPGDPRNIKVTTPDDLPLAEALAARFDNGRWTDA
jgi:2-C-methyl-D-erythritol 4-phosphate cytidylyltransferase